uniref:Retrovirus-related Pol polyprotein from transposon TNT 1-94-like beta-barrel domain-containing protein n=1 Tax=Nicotiana tabacum TaxID=4097 RepID=A0A1S4C3A6_TOBAC|nr:PREDICTED: uncharacterized protein LOC107814621 [Nicotiana tabacum]
MLWRELFLPVFKGHGVYGFIDGSFPCPEPTILHNDGNSRTLPFNSGFNLTPLFFHRFKQQFPKRFSKLLSSQIILSLLQTRGFKSNALTSIGNPISESDLVLQILSGLTPEYMSVSTSISTRVPLPTFIEARSLIFLHEAQLSSFSNSTMNNSTTAFMAKQQSSPSYGRGRGRHNNGGRGRYNQGNTKFFNVGPQQFTPRPRLPSILGLPPISYPAAFNPSQPNNVTFYCQLCYQPHHTARDCPSLNSKAFVSDISSNYSCSSPGDASWFVDSGASSHMTPNASNLSFITPYNSSDSVVMGNGTQFHISYIGYSIFSTSDSLFSLRDILVVPYLSTNLRSIRKFVSDNNCSMEFDPFGFSIK